MSNNIMFIFAYKSTKKQTHILSKTGETNQQPKKHPLFLKDLSAFI